VRDGPCGRVCARRRDTRAARRLRCAVRVCGGARGARAAKDVVVRMAQAKSRRRLLASRPARSRTDEPRHACGAGATPSGTPPVSRRAGTTGRRVPADAHLAVGPRLSRVTVKAAARHARTGSVPSQKSPHLVLSCPCGRNDLPSPMLARPR
jgi:hypothetical protein